MPQYTEKQLITISQALFEKFPGLSLTVLWWNSHRGWHEDIATVMRRPVKEMPLFIDDENEGVRIIARERLKFKRRK